MDIYLGRQTFNVPCRRFTIRLTVSNQERLPLVREFSLRYLNLVGACSGESLGHFFGFSDRELSILLADLKTAGFIDYVGDEMKLTDKGRDLFRHNEEGALHIRSVEKWNERFAIDFISFRVIHFVPRTDSFRCFHNLVSADQGKVSRSREIAKETFADSFHEYVERYKQNISNEERARLSIYGISSIESGDTFEFPLSVDLYVNSDSPKQVDQRYSVFDSDAAQESRQRLVQEVSRTINRLKEKSKFGSDLLWLTNEQLRVPIFSELSQDGQIEIGSLLCQIQHLRDSAPASASTVPVIGSFYTDENSKIIFDFVRNSTGSIKTDSDKKEAQLENVVYWQKPSTELWGSNEETFSLISRIRREVTSVVVGKSEISLVGNANFENVKTLRWRLTRRNNRNVFDQGYVAALREEMGPVEIFIWPGVVCGVLYYYLADTSWEYPIPLGFVSKDAEVLDVLSKFLFSQWAGYGRKVVRAWPVKGKGAAPVEVKGKDAFAALLDGVQKKKADRPVKQHPKLTRYQRAILTRL